MLPKLHRLVSPSDFKKVKDLGKIVQSESFGLLYLHTQPDSLSRFGFVVSTKISKKAVVRNKIKRLLRAAVKLSLPNLSTGYDVLFLSRIKLAEKTLNEVSDEINRVFEKIRQTK